MAKKEPEVAVAAEPEKPKVMCGLDLPHGKGYIFAVDQSKNIELVLLEVILRDEYGGKVSFNVLLAEQMKIVKEKVENPDVEILGVSGNIQKGKEHLKGEFLKDLTRYLEVKIPTSEKALKDFKLLKVGKGIPSYPIRNISEMITNDYEVHSYEGFLERYPEGAVISDITEASSSFLVDGSKITYGFKNLSGARLALESLKKYPLLTEDDKRLVTRCKVHKVIDFPTEKGRAKNARFYCFEEWSEFLAYLVGQTD